MATAEATSACGACCGGSCRSCKPAQPTNIYLRPEALQSVACTPRSLHFPLHLQRAGMHLL